MQIKNAFRFLMRAGKIIFICGLFRQTVSKRRFFSQSPSLFLSLEPKEDEEVSASSPRRLLTKIFESQIFACANSPDKNQPITDSAPWQDSFQKGGRQRMQIKREKEIQETSTMLALTMVLLKILMMLIVGGVFWLVEIILDQQNQFNNVLRGFMP